MNFSAFSIKNPIPAIILFVMLLLAGIMAFKTTAVQDFPDIDLPIVTVSAILEGTAPAQLETEVARKLENAVATLEGVKHILTSVREGEVTIQVQFVLEKVTAEAVSEVRNAVDRIRSDLPSDLRDQSVTGQQCRSCGAGLYSVIKQTRRTGVILVCGQYGYQAAAYGARCAGAASRFRRCAGSNPDFPEPCPSSKPLHSRD